MNNTSNNSTTDSISQFTESSQTVDALMNVQSSNTIHEAATFPVTPDRTPCSNNIPRLPQVISPANSIVSSGVCSNVCSSQSLTKTAKKRKSSKCNNDTYSDDIKITADTLQQPIVVKPPDIAVNNLSCDTSDPVDACMAFVGSLLKNIKNKVLKLDVMHVLIQTVINASTTDLENINNT
ncbi:uncharacterized protein LOC116852656 [Odontomachus brunneus]|uniref:uncharacterized protein LOC116852656 n=1 Tax=Odontomachus brunneus TaxID=486640 RepID=UPI0013F22561|nr:uncharacterized protein LOC116852656 [Odontomachus brunneus]